MKTTLILALIVGGIVAASVQPFTPTGWWLNTSQGVVLTSLALALLAAVMGAIMAVPTASRTLPYAVALWAGANVGMAIVLFKVGPGTIFPLVLLFGAGISALAVGAGSLLGTFARRLSGV